jgi:hypothetical protein
MFGDSPKFRREASRNHAGFLKVGENYLWCVSAESLKGAGGTVLIRNYLHVYAESAARGFQHGVHLVRNISTGDKNPDV